MGSVFIALPISLFVSKITQKVMPNNFFKYGENMNQKILEVI